MNADALVADAREWANKLTVRESRGPGDTENAMRRLSARYGLDYGALWALRYRPPKRIFADVYFALAAAYQAECERQQRLLAHDIAKTKAIAGARNSAVVAAEAVVGAGDDETD